ncbi:Rieske 2Fe-2S domain-containing protein [Phycicoccus sp. SLBN-51]|jgi:ubiquinol-cytochrome c reductase iron-sulfur subunit|uniref:cytochrome bc1 complex Rieske iron-sulfur subunit n=1 Tax=Phycicoccus sp. SLBN-51 TaxID=2768447 RepID=UPI001152184C|nr:Rieske 2Fe-2S domain-containing protein [Phycicoccus sp. SLBN-51]TQJ50382.1 menaquinol-cytochrome c reductase iron-sulfur subunit precursor [Phycicoccus sp. SLBN-51]
MNEHGTEHGGQVQPGTEGYGSSAVRLDQGHVQGTGGLPERFEDPGFPPHIHRAADLDEAAAKRAEKQVATLFGLSILGTLIFIVAYFAIPMDASAYIPGIGDANLSNVVLGVSLAFGLLGIGVGAVHWAKTLMPDEEVVEERHPLRSSDEARGGFVKTMMTGGTEAQLSRRPLIKYSLGGALGLFALPVVIQVVGSLGPLPKDELSKTMWKKGDRLVRDPEHTPIKATDVTIGSVFHVLPESIKDSTHVLEDKAKAAVLLMRLEPEAIKVAKERDWGHEGIVAYSKICTHVGCPVGLYEQQTHHLLCPCHQSTFDVTQDCKVIFGPAKRPLPQLKITVDAEGYLVADAPFREAVGPSFWERG